MKHFLFFCFALFLMPSIGFAQWRDAFNAINTNQNNEQARPRQTGVGFNNGADLIGALNPFAPTGARFIVQNGILAHRLGTGFVGDFNNATGNGWTGLGLGNPGGGAQPYGLSIARNSGVGFYNLITEGGKENTVASFGTAVGRNMNRWVVRSYDNAQSSTTGKSILVANPLGAVGLNEEPFASLSVYSSPQFGTLDSAGIGTLVRAIAIRGSQKITDAGLRITTSSAMGNQANTSLQADNIVVEGTRAQIPSFAAGILPDNAATGQLPQGFQRGIGVNLQSVHDPLGNSALVASPTIGGTGQGIQYAELTWQDLDYGDPVTTVCPAAGAPPVDKFFISFRNAQPGIAGNNSFSSVNKLPVMTFTSNGRVGISTVNPACQVGNQPVFLDVNGAPKFGSNPFISSDARFKKDIRTVENALDKIRKLRGTTYAMRTDEFPERAFGEGRQYGFIAQELEKVLPEATGIGDDGFYAVNYSALIPVLTEAVKEQDATVETLRTELAENLSKI